MRNGRSGSLWKQELKPKKGNTSGAKVEDGTGFKVRRRLQSVYTKDFDGTSLKPVKTGWRFRKWLKRATT